MNLVKQKWEESERGWGVRPDGYSLHLTFADRDAYVRAYWDRMPDQEPDEYSRPSGDPISIEVDAETYRQVLAASDTHGLRRYR